jgi:hypothetical protein
MLEWINPIKVMHCLAERHENIVNPDCKRSIIQHSFVNCANIGVEICEDRLVDIGRNYRVDVVEKPSWKDELEPFTEAIKCLSERIGEIKEEMNLCKLWVRNSTFSLCGDELNQYCKSVRNGTAEEMLSCLIEKGIQNQTSTVCGQRLAKYPSRYPTFGAELQLKYAEAFMNLIEFPEFVTNPPTTLEPTKAPTTAKPSISPSTSESIIDASTTPRQITGIAAGVIAIGIVAIFVLRNRLRKNKRVQFVPADEHSQHAAHAFNDELIDDENLELEEFDREETQTHNNL